MTGALRLARHRATTAQLAGIVPAIAAPPDTRSPVILGYSAVGDGPFRFDPFDAYVRRRVANPNVFVFGEPGSGKSAAVKTMLHRWVGLREPGRQRRWVAVCDPKGEYAPLAASLGLDVISLRPGGDVRLNPLERGTPAEGDDSIRHTALLASLVTCLLHRELTPLEDAALGWTVAELGRRDEVATVADVAGLLASPTEGICSVSGMDPPELVRAGEDVRLVLGKLLHRDLRGMFDGPSTIRPERMANGIVIDLSAVHADRDALALVMVAATAWIQAALAREDGIQRLQVVDEAWALLSTPSAVRHLQASWKLCRDYGVANLAVAHRISDLRGQADDGTALSKMAAGLLADTETRILFRQAADQIPDARRFLDLTPTEADILPRLACGRALWKRPDGSALVQHIIAGPEWRFCDTDAALQGRRRDFCDDLPPSANFRQELATS